VRTLSVVLLVSVLLGVPVAAVPNPPSEELQANRRVVGKWRGDPEHYNRLKGDLKWFRTLPPERQARLRQFDLDLNQEDPATRERLWTLMDRYVTWLGRLTPADRQKVEAAATPTERLEVIRQLREREWLDRLPQARKKELAGKPESERRALLLAWREEDRERRRRLDLGPPNPQPTRLAEFPGEIQAYVRTVLLPALTPEERQHLNQAEGQPWPEYARRLLGLAEKHPMVFPGAVSRPMLQRDLPKPVRERIKELLPTMPAADREKLRSAQAQGHWPQSGIAITEVLRKYGPLPVELGPCQPAQFSLPMQRFIERLTLKLDDRQKLQLRDAEGSWPEYPQRLVELANAHKLPIPGMKLPEPRDWSWDKVRTGN
jgi:hypothetical protein